MILFDPLSIGHFTLYYILGLYLKNYYLVAFLLGIAWEIFEYNLIRNSLVRELLIKHWFIPQRIWDEKSENRISDLVFNMLGYHLGNKTKFI